MPSIRSFFPFHLWRRVLASAVDPRVAAPEREQQRARARRAERRRWPLLRQLRYAQLRDAHRFQLWKRWQLASPHRDLVDQLLLGNSHGVLRRLLEDFEAALPAAATGSRYSRGRAYLLKLRREVGRALAASGQLD